ncbi:hypothetical protein QQS21_010907 [Conoideocrella luteorostrata]|uniref:GST N-terminal domain-containing protein n=1 Tax=Conoideocrella luteorostrata TaxID=1105319 RepID=A0AAJ0FNX0_9HYPO|nr:hypothetical protein QQS21_010907 [Conoideocrella luteorostrata]
MAAPGSSLSGSGAGLPGVGQFRIDIGVGLLDGYPGPDDAYQQSPNGSYGRLSLQGEQQGVGGGGQFGILAPATVPSGILDSHLDASRQMLFAMDGHNTTGQETTVMHGDKSHGKLPSKIVVDPPDLAVWREKLFNVDDMIVLTDEQFETYFPHVDNVYSHRSTQRYKRKPFVSHYWDCRMKGRPPGTAKSEDPSKKKRKRNARERDLCDVKIRITEYFPNASTYVDREAAEAAAAAGATLPTGQRFWTVQRVNGNGGNGKGDGVAGPHRHTLEKSDEIKRNSVQRYLAQQEKDVKKTQKLPARKATGAAAATMKRHLKEHDFKLYSACYCPFSQRVWIALETKGLPYQYCEIDPSKPSPPAAFTTASPRGTVPAIRQREWTCSESATILEYLEDLDTTVRLLPTDPRHKAKCRLWIDHINTRIVPAFHALLSAHEPTSQSDSTNRLQSHITSLVLAADEQGPFFTGSSFGLVDIHFAPFAIRLSRILRPLRGWTDPVPGTRWNRWLDALEKNSHVKSTTSSSELYLDVVDVLARGTGGPQ